MTRLILLSLSLMLAVQLASAYLNLDFLDLRAVSMIRSDLRAAPKSEQCVMFWKALRERIDKDLGLERLEPPGRDKIPVDMETLVKLSATLRGHKSYQNLAVYVSNCIVQLIDHPRMSLEKDLEESRRQRPQLRPPPQPKVAGPAEPLSESQKLAQRWREKLGG